MPNMSWIRKITFRRWICRNILGLTFRYPDGLTLMKVVGMHSYFTTLVSKVLSLSRYTEANSTSPIQGREM